MPDPGILVLVRVLLGAVGPCCLEDGVMLMLPADKAADLVQAGDAVYVASSFQYSRRRENLSFSHHRDVAVCGLTPRMA